MRLSGGRREIRSTLENWPMKMIKNFRDHAANEQMFLAWVRTAIAVMAFGFLVVRFDLFLEIAEPSLAGRPLPVQPEIRQHRRIGADRVWHSYDRSCCHSLSDDCKSHRQPRGGSEYRHTDRSGTRRAVFSTRLISFPLFDTCVHFHRLTLPASPLHDLSNRGMIVVV